MKSKLFALIVLSVVALEVEASNSVTLNPGDPKKEKEKGPTFKLSSGYFNLFNIWNTEPAKTDTISQKILPVLPKQVVKSTSGI